MYGIAVSNKQDKRKARYAQVGCQRSVFIRVYFVNDDPILVLSGDFFKHRSEFPARRAPICGARSIPCGKHWAVAGWTPTGRASALLLMARLKCRSRQVSESIRKRPQRKRSGWTWTSSMCSSGCVAGTAIPLQSSVPPASRLSSPQCICIAATL